MPEKLNLDDLETEELYPDYNGESLLYFARKGFRSDAAYIKALEEELGEACTCGHIPHMNGDEECLAPGCDCTAFAFF